MAKPASGTWRTRASSPGPSWRAPFAGERAIELARRAAELAGIDAGRLEAKAAEEFGFTAPRPRYCALASERGALLPTLDDALRRYIDLRNADRDERRELEAQAERRQDVAGGERQAELDEAIHSGT
jgi:dTDP-4-dehydrorhamnose reductase